MGKAVDEVFGDFPDPYYHVAVICDDRDDPRDGYSDGLDYEAARLGADSLVITTAGRGLRAVYIVKGYRDTCPLAHHGQPERDPDAVADFVTGQEPYWSKDARKRFTTTPALSVGG